MYELPRRPQSVAGFEPGGVLRGAFRAPGSKSIAQRALLAASLASGTTRIAGLPDGEDVAAAEALVRAVGAEVERLAPRARSIRGLPPGPHRGWRPTGTLRAGESGTLARLALAASALCGDGRMEFELDAEGTLRRRSSPALIDALMRSGVSFASTSWPLRLRPLGPPSRIELRSPTSSQEVSALLLALAAYPDEIELVVVGAIPSRPYVAMTCALLERFSARVAREGDGELETFRVRGPLRAPGDPIEIEPDASLAAVALVAACIGGGELDARGLGASSIQGDLRIAEHLRSFGCDASCDRDGLRARGAPTRPATIDLRGEPDLAPPLAALAAALASRRRGEACVSELSGLATLAGKESSRIETLATGLRVVGLEVEHASDRLAILRAGPPPSREVVVDARDDHRMAFAFALLGLAVPNVRVRDAGAVHKSWPSFWSDLEALGGRLVRA